MRHSGILNLRSVSLPKVAIETAMFPPSSAVCVVVAKFTSVMSIKITSLGKQHGANTAC